MRKIITILMFSLMTAFNCLSLPSLAENINDLDLQVAISGQGDTMVLFESGFGRGPEVWNRIVEQLPSDIITVRYARAGIGQSGERVKTSGIEQHLQDLSSLIQRFGQDKKLILVGHSYGGLVVSEFARRHSDQVAGLLLIDPTVAQQRAWFKAADAKAVADEDKLLAKMLPPRLQAQLQQLNAELDDAGQQVLPLPSDLKTILLTSTRIEPEPMVFIETAAGNTIWLKLHQALFAEVRDGSHLRLPTVGHNIMQEAPQTVLNALQTLL
ncbi:alpha/beta fold hydrolase [Rheinheimera baltica]|uniref:Alpha/beta hydrolase n=1 Tax=Rheinheimera baltica TaxID=67576 RepID=A0ABT9HZ90_9GAMM|nr:alpha/beta hydrolase [Rheinheimera baltica]MDP5136450.1 alpha/beta hydrolase [Rheinheimera baltica]MDP5143852.1 alpha/beta hydrolase [Rheinheimera baltica]MDP5151719.1 alpha/beta hydrolase [Rheinheimera baltica]MDP5190863.1 alpha/beta hydrolase [Rheinheimera baltica]